MSTTSVATNASYPGTRPLPLLVFFDQDELARKIPVGEQRYRRVSYEALNGLPRDLQRIVLVSREALLEDHYEELRAPNARVIALSDARFRDPRVDALVYAYVPPATPAELLERMVDNALDHMHLLASRQEVNERLAGATREIHQLNQIGAALSAEHDTEKLLETILTKSRELTQSDAGSLYLVERVEKVGEITRRVLPPGVEPGKAAVKAGEEEEVEVIKRLRFKLAQNDSVQISFREAAMEIDDRSIAGYVALTGEPVVIDDAYHLPPGVPYSINRKFDEDSHYRTKSILAVPMRDQKDEIVGVLQLINAKRDFAVKIDTLSAVMANVIAYTQRQQELVGSLASQAAVALENSRLYEAIQKLFEGFVKASVTAIEARDPTTSGHSFRVANLTVALAELVDRSDRGPYAGVHFSRQEMREIRYASLLHDFGKVGVREEVLVKAKKLYPSQLELIRQRFQFVKRTLENEMLRQRLRYVLDKGRDAYLKKQAALDSRLDQQLAELDEYLNDVVKSNEPTVLPQGSFERLLDIAGRKYLDYDGAEKTLLDGDEVRLLSIRKGSLDDNERLQIESHVVHTVNFLQQIPWTQEIRMIPDIARGHHEKLNGSGYPYKLSAPEIPLQTRMMTISDIFDALSASDRPYKRAVSLERALEILDLAVKDGELDPALFQLFLEGRVFERWKIEPYPY